MSVGRGVAGPNRPDFGTECDEVGEVPLAHVDTCGIPELPEPNVPEGPLLLDVYTAEGPETTEPSVYDVLPLRELESDIPISSGSSLKVGKLELG